jgi:hypothetical protein
MAQLTTAHALVYNADSAVQYTLLHCTVLHTAHIARKAQVAIKTTRKRKRKKNSIAGVT